MALFTHELRGIVTALLSYILLQQWEGVNGLIFMKSHSTMRLTIVMLYSPMALLLTMIISIDLLASHFDPCMVEHRTVLCNGAVGYHGQKTSKLRS